MRMHAKKDQSDYPLVVNSEGHLPVSLSGECLNKFTSKIEVLFRNYYVRDELLGASENDFQASISQLELLKEQVFFAP